MTNCPSSCAMRLCPGKSHVSTGRRGGRSPIGVDLPHLPWPRKGPTVNSRRCKLRIAIPTDLPTLKGLNVHKFGPFRAERAIRVCFRRCHLRLFTVSRFAGARCIDAA